MTDLAEDRQRQAYLELLYEADGRNERCHPCHGLYTGLLEQRRQQLLDLDRALLLGLG